MRGRADTGDLLVRLKVLPADVEVRPETLAQAIEGALPAGAQLVSTGEEPIAFGLVAVLADVAVQEGEGAVDGLESAIRSLPTAGQVEVVGVSRRTATLR